MTEAPTQFEPLLPGSGLVRYVESKQELKNRSEDFNQWRVEVRDTIQVKDKIRAMQKDGPSNVVIIADFDHTISQLYVPDGIRQERDERLNLFDAQRQIMQMKTQGQIALNSQSTIQVMLEHNRITQEDMDETKRLYRKYRPMEIDPELSFELKSQAVMDWLLENLKLFISLDMTDSDLRSIAAKSKMACRYGIMELFDQIKTNNIPFVVVSGGVKDVIDVILYEIIRESNFKKGDDSSLYDLKEYERLQQVYNFTVLSNTFNSKSVYNQRSELFERLVTSINPKLVTSMNKYEFVNEDHADVMQAFKRKNAIVLGDQLHDVQVVKDSDYETILNIGYLNDDSSEEQYESFMNTFDILVCKDGPLLPLNMVLDQIAYPSKDIGKQNPYCEFTQLNGLSKILQDKQ